MRRISVTMVQYFTVLKDSKFKVWIMLMFERFSVFYCTCS
jgi:hypothetical protein